MKHCIGAIRARALKVIGMVIMVLAFMIGTLPFSSPAKAAGEFAGMDPGPCLDYCDSYKRECVINRGNDPLAEPFCDAVVAVCRAKCLEYTAID